MADSKISALTALTGANVQTSADVLAIVDNSVTTTKKILAGELAAAIGVQFACEFRLTLTTAVPVTTADVTGAGTIFCAPYKGNRIALYDGSAVWNIYASAEFSLALTLTSGKPYDVFCYDNSGVPTLEVLVWTNDTTRATALTTQNGVLVKTGATTRRYLGTIYASGANTTEDSEAKRYVWNYYNRVSRSMKVVESTDTWTYTTATLRQARASAANQLDFVRGVAEDVVCAQVVSTASNSGAANTAQLVVGIGIDSTTTNSATVIAPSNNSVADVPVLPNASYIGIPAAGRHTIPWLEYSTASGTTTWYGDNGTPSVLQSGIFGELLA